jgi:hypothetical protein
MKKLCETNQGDIFIAGWKGTKETHDVKPIAKDTIICWQDSLNN